MSDIETPITCNNETYETYETNECSICLNIIDNIVITQCNHIFCKKCLEEWLDTSKTICPLCRTDIKFYKDDLISYKIIKIPNLSIQSVNTGINADVYSNLINKVYLLRYYTFVMTLSLLYCYIRISSLLLNVNTLNTEYNRCITNNTYLSHIIDDTYSDGQPYIDTIIYYNNVYKKCDIPEKYYNNC